MYSTGRFPSLKNLPLPVPNESLPYWFQVNFAASFVLNFFWREFLLSALANRFELSCEPQRLMLLYYKICPSSFRIKKILRMAKVFCSLYLISFQMVDTPK